MKGTGTNIDPHLGVRDVVKLELVLVTEEEICDDCPRIPLTIKRQSSISNTKHYAVYE